MDWIQLAVVNILSKYEGTSREPVNCYILFVMGALVHAFALVQVSHCMCLNLPFVCARVTECV